MKQREVRTRALAILTISLLPLCAYGRSELPRSLALKGIDDSIAHVRQDINAPHIEVTLIDALAGPVGDDPRIIPLCREVLDKTTNPANAVIAVKALGVIYEKHTGPFAFKRKAEIASALESAVNKDQKAGLEAARFLTTMGGKYRDEAYAYYLRQLPEAGANLTDEQRWHIVEIIDKILDFKRKDSLGRIRELVQSQKLTDLLETRAKAETNPALKTYDERMLKRWQVAVGKKAD